MTDDSLPPSGCSEQRWRAAVHEVGHAQMGLAFNASILSMGLDRDGEGHCAARLPAGKGTPQQLAFASMMLDYAGIAAERIVCGGPADEMRPSWKADIESAIANSKRYSSDPRRQREVRRQAREYVEKLLRPIQGPLVAVARMVAENTGINPNKLMASLLPAAAAEVQRQILKG